MYLKTKRIIKKISLVGFFSTLIYLVLFVFVSAENINYTLLEKLPGISGVKSGEFGVYLSKMFKLSLQLATVLAVFMISFGGFKYLTVDSFTGKSDAKKTITNAVVGLLILLTSWLLLYTINPDLVQNEFKIPPVNTKSSNN